MSCEGKQNIVASEDRVMNKDGRCIAAVLQKQKKSKVLVLCFVLFFLFFEGNQKRKQLKAGHLCINILLFSLFFFAF